jgi:hypothetical protein
VPREATVPISVWLPALAAAVVVALCWRAGASAGVDSKPTHEPAPPIAPAKQVPEPELSPPPESKPVSHPASKPEPKPESPPPPKPAPKPEPPPPPKPAPKPEPPKDPGLPPGWNRLDDEARSLHSGAALAPFVVTLAAEQEALARALAGFHDRLIERVLAPASLADSRGASLESFEVAADETAESATSRLGEAWLASLQEERGLAPPRFWSAGAIEAARAESLRDALLAAPTEASLAALLDPEAGEDAAWRATAGSFAAWCLGGSASGGHPDAHRRATWLEFARSVLPDASKEGRDAVAAELASRFGATRLEELDAAFRAARRP